MFCRFHGYLYLFFFHLILTFLLFKYLSTSPSLYYDSVVQWLVNLTRNLLAWVWILAWVIALYSPRRSFFLSERSIKGTCGGLRKVGCGDLNVTLVLYPFDGSPNIGSKDQRDGDELRRHAQLWLMFILTLLQSHFLWRLRNLQHSRWFYHQAWYNISGHWLIYLNVFIARHLRFLFLVRENLHPTL